MTDKWAEQLAACDLVIVSVSKRMRATLLGTEREPFLPAAAKIRKIPFMVGRPTFEAVREAYLRLATITFIEERHVDALVAKFRPAATPEESAAAAAAAAAA